MTPLAAKVIWLIGVVGWFICGYALMFGATDQHGLLGLTALGSAWHIGDWNVLAHSGFFLGGTCESALDFTRGLKLAERIGHCLDDGAEQRPVAQDRRDILEDDPRLRVVGDGPERVQHVAGERRHGRHRMSKLLVGICGSSA